MQREPVEISLVGACRASGVEPAAPSSSSWTATGSLTRSKGPPASTSSPSWRPSEREGAPGQAPGSQEQRDERVARRLRKPHTQWLCNCRLDSLPAHFQQTAGAVLLMRSLRSYGYQAPALSPGAASRGAWRRRAPGASTIWIPSHRPRPAGSLALCPPPLTANASADSGCVWTFPGPLPTSPCVILVAGRCAPRPNGQLTS